MDDSIGPDPKDRENGDLSLKIKGMPRHTRAGVRRSSSYSRARIYDYSAQYKSSCGVSALKINHHRNNMVPPSPPGRTRLEVVLGGIIRASG
jgi:hypothetical protein